MENRFEIDEAIKKLESMLDVLHTACSGDFYISEESLIGFTNVMSDVLMDLKRALESK